MKTKPTTCLPEILPVDLMVLMFQGGEEPFIYITIWPADLDIICPETKDIIDNQAIEKFQIQGCYYVCSETGKSFRGIWRQKNAKDKKNQEAYVIGTFNQSPSHLFPGLILGVFQPNNPDHMINQAITIQKISRRL